MELGRFFKLFIDGGPVIMLSILLSSFLALFIIIERMLFFKKISINEDKIIDRLNSAIKNRHYDEALTICETVPSPVTNLMKAGIRNRQYSDLAIQESIKDAANMEIPKLEKNLTALGTIANITPLLGLLGTVIGNMQAFGIIGSNDALGNMQLLAGGIAKALLTTAFGLSVAIPSSIAYNFLAKRANNMVLTLETRVNELVKVIVHNKKG
jgi:biopolymer transport protein ExbB